MKRAVLLVGTNAAGKTTSLKSSLEELGSHSLDMRVIWADSGDKVEFFDQNPEENVRRQLALWNSDTQLLIIEGTRCCTPFARLAQKETGRTLEAVVVLVSPADHVAMLRRRCNKNGKKFNAEYWTLRQSTYDGQKRYLNSLLNYGVKNITKVWMDADYAAVPELISLLVKKIRGECDGP